MHDGALFGVDIRTVLFSSWDDFVVCFSTTLPGPGAGNVSILVSSIAGLRSHTLFLTSLLLLV